MSIAIITLADDGAGQVDVTLDFGATGTDEGSAAHRAAAAMLAGVADRVIPGSYEESSDV